MSVVPRLRNPALDVTEPDSFPKIKYELCEEGRQNWSPRQCRVGSVAEANFLSPLGQ